MTVYELKEIVDRAIAEGKGSWGVMITSDDLGDEHSLIIYNPDDFSAEDTLIL